ncbi:3-phosphoserine/phosphohydroxythreonine transaminase [Algiphilus sp.]|uniref:3-phosphoserine/phosphohydroxythreonine transaminase n=1 Tax=Algiphilus sp. TaxID=1872431 RepID=UPI003B52430C
MSRVFNFSAGPATLPEAVLEQVRDDLLDWRGNGMSVMEMSHRDKAFMSIAEEAEADLRKLLNVPDNYKVLFLQGGATGQFAFVPLNLMPEGGSADYVVTGSWGKKAIKEAAKYGTANTAARPADDVFNHIPARSEWKLDPKASYVHYTPNETIEGVEFHQAPDVGEVPLVGDFSSTILSRPVNVAQHGVIYAGAQKNAGPAGLTMVIVRDDLIGNARASTPSIFDYKAVAEADSMLNTPPCFAWYVSGLIFKWLLDQGGLESMAERNHRKAQMLYDYIDSEPFYTNPVAPADRSWMNVTFTMANPDLDKPFIEGATKAGMPGLKGHRSVGGMRASIYNAMPEVGVQSLIDYMKEFVRQHG